MILSNPYRGERRPGSVGLPLPGIEVRAVADSGTEEQAGMRPPCIWWCGVWSCACSVSGKLPGLGLGPLQVRFCSMFGKLPGLGLGPLQVHFCSMSGKLPGLGLGPLQVRFCREHAASPSTVLTKPTAMKSLIICRSATGCRSLRCPPQARRARAVRLQARASCACAGPTSSENTGTGPRPPLRRLTRTAGSGAPLLTVLPCAYHQARVQHDGPPPNAFCALRAGCHPRTSLQAAQDIRGAPRTHAASCRVCCGPATAKDGRSGRAGTRSLMPMWRDLG